MWENIVCKREGISQLKYPAANSENFFLFKFSSVISLSLISSFPIMTKSIILISSTLHYRFNKQIILKFLWTFLNSLKFFFTICDETTIGNVQNFLL